MDFKLTLWQMLNFVLYALILVWVLKYFFKKTKQQ